MKHYIHISKKEETIAAMRSKLLEIFPDEALAFPIVYNGKLIVFKSGETSGLNKFFEDKLRPFHFSTQQLKTLKKKMRNKQSTEITLEHLLNIIIVTCVWFYKEKNGDFEFKERYGEIKEEERSDVEAPDEAVSEPKPEEKVPENDSYEEELTFLPPIDLKISDMSID